MLLLECWLTPELPALEKLRPELEQPAQETNSPQKLKDPYSNMPNRLNKTDSHELG